MGLREIKKGTADSKSAGLAYRWVEGEFRPGFSWSGNFYFTPFSGSHDPWSFLTNII